VTEQTNLWTGGGGGGGRQRDGEERREARILGSRAPKHDGNLGQAKRQTRQDGSRGIKRRVRRGRDVVYVEVLVSSS
jgi:hypothetical protein